MRSILLAAACCLALAGCGGPKSVDLPSPAASFTAAPDDEDAGERLARYAALPQTERAAARAAAEQAALPWRDFEDRAFVHYDRLFRGWYYNGVPWTYSAPNARALAAATAALDEATRIDPLFVEGWAAAGRLRLEYGDLRAARHDLELARLAAAALGQAGEPVERDVDRRIQADLGWLAYDAGLHDDGLAAVAEGLARAPQDQELLLIRGLLLASAGRFDEAMAAAVNLPPVLVHDNNYLGRGFVPKPSAYANQWIRAVAWLRAGDPAMAWHMLDQVDRWFYRGRIAYADRFWRDAGLAAELAGDPNADRWYAAGQLGRRYDGFFPVSFQSVDEQVVGLPDPHMPLFTAFGHRYYVGGSPLSYVGLQVNIATTALTRQSRYDAIIRGLDMLDILERRSLAPVFRHAARGRLLYLGDELDRAVPELEQARRLLAERGEIDAVTSMILGLAAIDADRPADAAVLLRETVTAEPHLASAWRMLGVALAQQGEWDDAGRAMDRALALEPGNIAGWYNRGLMRLQKRAFAAAASDLAVAYELDPDNREVQRLLQLAASSARAGGETVQVDPSLAAAAVASGDTVLAGLEAELDALFAPPESQALDGAAAAAMLLRLERRYAEAGDPVARRDLALAYLDCRRLGDVQRLLAAGWGVDLAPDEEMILLYADRQLGEVERAEDLKRTLLTGEAGVNPYAILMTALVIRDHDIRGGVSRVSHAFAKYCEGTKARSYGFPMDKDISEWMREGFAESRSRRGDPDGDIDTNPLGRRSLSELAAPARTPSTPVSGK
jgi:tetratricopeptide (TPR) repeat protein